MEEFASSKTALIADVDCTAEGKGLCNKIGVSGYPTIKYGDPNDLQDYQGGRELADLQTFAKENLGPSCGPAYPDLCSKSELKKMKKFQKMDKEALEKYIKKNDKKIKDAETDLEKAKEDCKARINHKTKQKDKLTEKIKKKGLGMAKAVLAASQSEADGEEEEKEEL